jgi:hypothetical protein
MSGLPWGAGVVGSNPVAPNHFPISRHTRSSPIIWNGLVILQVDIQADSFVIALALEPAIHSDPEIMGGTPVFLGTRVPLATLLDYLEAGQPVEEGRADRGPRTGLPLTSNRLTIG